MQLLNNVYYNEMEELFQIPNYYIVQQKMIFELDLMHQLAEKWMERID